MPRESPPDGMAHTSVRPYTNKLSRKELLLRGGLGSLPGEQKVCVGGLHGVWKRGGTDMVERRKSGASTGGLCSHPRLSSPR